MLPLNLLLARLLDLVGCDLMVESVRTGAGVRFMTSRVSRGARCWFVEDVITVMLDSSGFGGTEPATGLPEDMMPETDLGAAPVSDPAADAAELEATPRAEAREYTDDMEARLMSESVKDDLVVRGRSGWNVEVEEDMPSPDRVTSRSGLGLFWAMSLAKDSESIPASTDLLESRRLRQRDERGLLRGFEEAAPDVCEGAGGGGIDRLAGSACASVVPGSA